jgi:hypothetical protein
MASIVFFMILVGVSVLFEREFKREKTDRNKKNKCSKCCRHLQENEKKTIDNFIVCDACHNRQFEEPTKEKLVKDIKWFLALSVGGLVVFIELFWPFHFLSEAYNFREALTMWSHFILLVVLPFSKTAACYKEYKKIRDKKSLL